jgi:two-component system, LytTR family, response regulator
VIHQAPTSLEELFTVRCTGRTYVFVLSEVIRLEAKSNYTIIYSIKRPPLLTARVLALFEEYLQGKGFLRAHRSHLVNRQHISGLDKLGNIYLSDNGRVEVSRRKKGEVKKIIGVTN